MTIAGQERLKRRAEIEERAGRPWRAKELLRNAIQGYDPDLFERYGRILLAMQDLKEAGLWLFLSARRRPEYGDAIEAFLDRCGRRGPRRLYAAFPACARLPSLADYPEGLAVELRALGLPDELPESWGDGGRLAERLVTGVLVAILALLGLATAGLMALAHRLLAWLAIGLVG